MTRLTDDVQGVLRATLDAVRGTSGEPAVRTIAARLDEPLRVAIAGKVKAGKSTLLNALVGEELAPTDAGECTKIVTWYREGLSYRALLATGSQPPRPVRFTRDHGPIVVDLEGHAADEVERLVIEWPSGRLHEMTLIDTPGLASLSTDVSDRTRAFLAPGDDEPAAADAVLYLMRHAHATDVRFLEAFHDEEVAHANPVNAIGVLARADEVGAGKLDALDAAARIAARYRSDANLRRLCQTVVPVAGLLAFTGTTLLEAEFRALARISQAPVDDTSRLLLTADRFVASGTGEGPVADAAGLMPEERQHLLDRLGLFGVRLSVDLIRRGVAQNAAGLSAQLVATSGLDTLREVLATQFARRSDILKARSALVALEAVCDRLETGVRDHLVRELERVRASAHELTELRLLNAIRSGGVALRTEDADELERLIGVMGTEPASRAGLPAHAPPDEVRDRLVGAIARWRAMSESPVASRTTADAARIVVRSCEGAVASLAVAGTDG